eukprot:GSMAST32.ASY1.ANO1.1013.1 assembled CDS
MADKFKAGMENMSSKMNAGGGGGGSRIIMAAKAVAGAGALAGLAYNSVFTVDGGHRAVVYSRLTGMQPGVKKEGIHFVIPWLERPYIYDIRTRPHTSHSLTGSQDLQMVNINLRILHKPNKDTLAEMYRQLGYNYDEKVLPSIVNEVLKSVVARFNATELLTKRDSVSAEIKRELTSRATDFFIEVEDVSIIDLAFGREFTAAVEAKQVAQQEAQPFLELRKIEAAKEISQAVARGGNRLFLSADSLLMDLIESSTSSTNGNSSGSWSG